jgi:hypothetical protein
LAEHASNKIIKMVIVIDLVILFCCNNTKIIPKKTLRPLRRWKKQIS